MCTPQIMCLVEDKSGEGEASNIITSGRGVEWCPLNGPWAGCSEKDMTCNDK